VSYIATSPDSEAVAREGLLREVAKLREAPVSDEELERAKAYAIGTYAIHQSSGAAVLGDVVEAWLFGRLAELDEHDARVRAVTAAQMQALARRYFDDARIVQGIVRGVGSRESAAARPGERAAGRVPGGAGRVADGSR
jgi:zinc protease